MMLVAAGDSFTYGQELAPPEFVTNSQGLFDPIPSADAAGMIDRFRIEHAWPSVLQHRLGFDRCVNLGRPGLSIDQISSKLLSWMDENTGSIDRDGTMIVVGWTNPGRISYYDEKISKWKICYPAHWNENPISKFYYQNMHSDLESYQRYWKNLLLVQGMAEKRGIKCIMFNAFALAPLTDGAIGYTNLVDQSSLCFEFDMKRYCNDQGCRVAPGGHPAADGHQAWAEYLDQWIRSNPSVIPPQLRHAW